MRIGGQTIGGDRCYVIAEAGHNHCGDIKIAERMIYAAAEAGADAIKFQIRHNETLYTREFYDSPYESENAYGPTYGQHREALELSIEAFDWLHGKARQAGITMFATAFDTWAVDACVNLGFPAIKIASGDLTNIPLIRYAAGTGLPIILSTGGSLEYDIQKAVTAARYSAPVAVLQCTASYPCPYKDLDLGVIAAWRHKLWMPEILGASLHDNGIAMAVAAYCMGARIIEKHFTLDRTMRGTDHAFSLEPQGLRKLVRDVRRVEVALGAVKHVHPEELAPLRKMRKSIYAARRLPAGHVVALEDLAFRSPADPEGLTPAFADDLVGRQIIGDVELEGVIFWENTREQADARAVRTS